ncbi:hypothetical protein [Antarctobacter heliothermus]|uniref:hypothetical protein n=1 Tax=Antarctobacter heliothermus TaxID=74033 RepID=UPI000B77D8F0|nr:hypothetical protein [Antarctobacter heliothermus]
MTHFKTLFLPAAVAPRPAFLSALSGLFRSGPAHHDPPTSPALSDHLRRDIGVAPAGAAMPSTGTAMLNSLR